MPQIKASLVEKATGKVVAKLDAPSVDLLTTHLEGKEETHELVFEDLPLPLPEVPTQHQRNALLNEWRWTVAPDSPLSQQNQAQWLVYLKALHRVTLSDPVSWPIQPGLEYAP